MCDVVESDSEPEVVCFANLGDSDGDDGLSDCESIEKVMYSIVKMTTKTPL